MMRDALFIVGVILMALALLLRLFPVPQDPPDRAYRVWLFDLGLLLAVAAHGWPGAL